MSGKKDSNGNGQIKKLYTLISLVLLLFTLLGGFAKVVLIGQDVKDVVKDTTIIAEGTLKNDVINNEKQNQKQELKIQALEIAIVNIKDDTEAILKKLDEMDK